MRLTRLFLSAAAALLLGISCDSANPVAPEGTTLTISAFPTRIALDGASTITVVANRSNGTPVPSGTRILFTTTLGSMPGFAETDGEGVARAQLQADGRIGVATVTASTTRSETESATVEVSIGELASSISVQVTPASVAASGGELAILALVRDAEGQPLEQAAVNFQSELGELDSAGGVLFTNDRGEVRDGLTVSAGDIASFNAPQFEVRAQVGGSGGQLIQDVFQVRILAAAPIADFVARGVGENQVFFENQTVGAEPLEFEWDFTNDGEIDSTQRSPTHDYGNPGTFTVRLVATNSFGADSRLQTITVPIP